jgi:hypothetical protein
MSNGSINRKKTDIHSSPLQRKPTPGKKLNGSVNTGKNSMSPYRPPLEMSNRKDDSLRSP